MLILPRYLLRQFLQIFAICFVSLMGLYIVIDAFGHLDHFSSYAEKEGNLLGVIARYYSYHCLGFFDDCSGLLAMISAMFTVGWLARHNELTAMMAAGISKFRIIRPLLLAAAGVSLLGVLNRELLVPRVRDELVRDTKDLSDSSTRDLEPRFDADSNILIGGAKVMLNERRILQPAFILLGPELARYGKQLAAETASYVDATIGRPAGFVLFGVTSPKGIARLPSTSVDGRPIVLTPRDNTWLNADAVFVASNMSFALLATGSKWQSYASLPELIGELRNPAASSGAEVQVAIHSRLMQALLDGTLVMLGLPIMLSRRSRNAYLSISLCLLLATAFTLTVLACQSLGGLHLLAPSLAAWLPLLIFVPVAAGLSQSLRT